MFDEIVNKYAVQFDVPALWIQAVIMTESSGNPKAYRSEPKINDASYGLMQLLYLTAKGMGYSGPAEGLFDPDTNILYGTKLLADLKRKYGMDVKRVYSAYNSGRPDLYLSSGEVSLHVTAFLKNLESSTVAFVKDNPVKIAAGSSFGVLLVFLILWEWKGK